MNSFFKGLIIILLSICGLFLGFLTSQKSIANIEILESSQPQQTQEESESCDINKALERLNGLAR